MATEQDIATTIQNVQGFTIERAYGTVDFWWDDENDLLLNATVVRGDRQIFSASIDHKPGDGYVAFVKAALDVADRAPSPEPTPGKENLA